MELKIAFVTLGCRLNQTETAVLTRQFVVHGYRVTEDVGEADLCVVNTCTLTHQAASKCRRVIRSIIRRNPDACIAAVGCYAQADVEELKKIEGLDYIVGTADKMRLAEVIPSPVKHQRPVVRRHRPVRERFTIDSPGLYPTRTRANVKVQEGCNFVCSFCIVPRSRGPARSRDFDDIVREARTLVGEGHRELVITGINVGTYEDRGRTLGDLVKALDVLDDLERIRLSSIEPTTIEKTLIDLMAGGSKLCPYLHIPFQSGDNRVLARMRRKHTVDEYTKFVDDVRSRIPNIGLGTDVMVGFPGEDQEAFDNTCSMVERVPYANVHVFSFSAREGTGAHRLVERVRGDVIAERSRILHEIAEAQKEEFYEQQKDQRLRVLFEERTSTGEWVGFADNYVKVGVAAPLDLSNRFGLARITGVTRRRQGPAQTDRGAEHDGSPSQLIAVGDLVDVEENATALAAHGTGNRASC